MRRQFGLPRQPNAPAKKKPGNKRGNKPANKPANKPVHNVAVKAAEIVHINDSSIINNLKNRHIDFENSGPFIVLK